MTDRLYCKDSSLLTFEGRIVETGRSDQSCYCVLDRSSFYPTSGGQLHDTGTLDKVVVVDVIETDDGNVRHLTESPVGDLGQTVSGAVNRTRRRRNCCHHTAQHIISQAFIRLFDSETVSVHLGEEQGSVELDRSEISEQQLDSTESMANDIVFDCLPVKIYFVNAEEAARLPLRKIPQRLGEIRVIQIGQFDWSACGGTHCANSSEVGLIKFIGVEKVRGRVSVRFIAGRLALEDYRRRYSVTAGLTRQLTCNLVEIQEKFWRLSDENKSLRRQFARISEELIPSRAEQLCKLAVKYGSINVVLAEDHQSDRKLAGKLAMAVAEKIDGLAMICTGNKLLIAVSPTSGLDAGTIARDISSVTSLKGGGSAAQAQLGGADFPDMDTIRDIIDKQLSDD